MRSRTPFSAGVLTSFSFSTGSRSKRISLRAAKIGANSATFYPSATEALYLPALALDPSGIVAKLVHCVFFVLLLMAVGRLAGTWAVLLVGSIPALAIAGITLGNVDEVLATGVGGIAVSSAVIGCDDPRAAA